MTKGHGGFNVFDSPRPHPDSTIRHEYGDRKFCLYHSALIQGNNVCIINNVQSSTLSVTMSDTLYHNILTFCEAFGET